MLMHLEDAPKRDESSQRVRIELRGVCVDAKTTGDRGVTECHPVFRWSIQALASYFDIVVCTTRTQIS